MTGQVKSVGAVLLCAGRSTRMGFDKLLACLGGQSVMERSLRALLDAGVERVAIAVNEATEAHARELAERYPGCVVVRGGARRQDSVYAGLLALEGADIAVIHDGARCLASPQLVRDSIASACEHGSGVAAIPCTDSLKRVRDGAIQGGIDRAGVWRMQTPQTFDYALVRRAYEQAMEDGTEATDDAALVERIRDVYIVRGSEGNIKLTTEADFARARASLEPQIRIGMGEDVHALAAGRALVLGGVSVPYERGLDGHSDADVLAHAVMDALLGALALGDIGRHFPPDDPAYEGADSMELLRRVMALVRGEGYAVENIDATVTAQQPRLAPYIAKMRQRLAEALGVEPHCVSVKATTAEHMGALGRGEGIGARCVALLRRV